MGRSGQRTVGAVVIALGLLASACSNSEGDEAVSSDPAPTSTAAAETTAAAPAPDAEAEADTTVAATPDTTEAAATDERDTFVPISGVPGVSDTEIVYASIGTKNNNPLGTDIKDAYNAGIKAYFAYRNDEGGIYGRQLVLGEEIDDELGNNQLRSLEVISSDEYFGTFVATLLFTGAADLDAAGVPTYIWNIHATEFANRSSLFGHVGAGCGDCTSQVGSYLAREAGATKVASLGYGTSENSKVCSQTQKAAFELYGPELGFEFVYLNDNVAFGMANGVGPEVTAMKDLGVDFISTCFDLNGMKTLAQELDRQGMQDVVMQHPNTYNQNFVDEAGGLFDGDYVGVSFAAFEYDTGLESQAKFIEYMEKQGTELSELAMTGWINAALAFDGLVAAGPEFDRASVIAATNELTAWNADGLVVPIDWSKQHTGPTNADRSTYYEQLCSSIVRIEDGAFVPVGPADKPFLCWPGRSTEWAEPEPMSFG